MRYAGLNRDAKLSPLTISKGGKNGQPNITGGALQVPAGKFEPKEPQEDKTPIWPKPKKPVLSSERKRRAAILSRQIRTAVIAHSQAADAGKRHLAQLTRERIEANKEELRKLLKGD